MQLYFFPPSNVALSKNCEKQTKLYFVENLLTHEKNLLGKNGAIVQRGNI